MTAPMPLAAPVMRAILPSKREPISNSLKYQSSLTWGADTDRDTLCASTGIATISAFRAIRRAGGSPSFETSVMILRYMWFVILVDAVQGPLHRRWSLRTHAKVQSLALSAMYPVHQSRLPIPAPTPQQNPANRCWPTLRGPRDPLGRGEPAQSAQ